VASGSAVSSGVRFEWGDGTAGEAGARFGSLGCQAKSVKFILEEMVFLFVCFLFFEQS
jgi:hypothetical protein